MTALVLRNAVIFDGSSPELMEGGEIVVVDGRIVEINPHASRTGSARAIDVSGRFVMPGLIDAHFHAYGADLNIGRLDHMPATLRALHARRILEDAASRGFTTVRDAGGGDMALVRATSAGLIKGPRIFPAGLAISQTGGHGDFRNPEHEPLCRCGYSGALSTVADGPDEVRRVARNQLRLGATQIKLFMSGGVTSPSDPLWMSGFSDEEIVAAVEEATRRRTYVMAHAHTPDAVIRCVRLGVRSIEHASILTAEAVEAIRTHDVFVVPTLAPIASVKRAGVSMGLTQSMLDKLLEVERHAFESFEMLRGAGIEVGFGSDLLGSLMDQQSTEFVLRGELSPPIDILRSATSVNARLMGLAREIGVVAVGARADLVVVDGNPLEHIGVMANPSALPFVMSGGVILKNVLPS